MNATPIPVVPGAGPVHKVLQTILQRCGAQHETQQACQRLHARLLALQVAVVDSRQTDAMSTFEAIVVQFLNHVERFRDQTLLLRVVTHRKKMTELETLNQRVDLLLDRLELFKLAARDWQQQLQDDNQLAEDFFKVTVKDRDVVFGALQDPQTQVEALMTLKFAIERQDSQGGGLVVVMKDLVLTIESLFQTRVDTLPLWFVPVTEVRCESKAFGRGPHGIVHRGVVGSNTKVVVKRFGVGELVIDERARLKVEKEVNSWHEMSHPNVVQLLAASHVSSPPFVLYEEALNGNLGSFLARSEENRRQMWKLLYQAALGLVYIHQRGMVHGNLKLNNILVGADGQAKVSDVGLATMRSCCSDFGSNSCGTLSSSVRWWAPECLQQRPSVASDVYSFGMCIIEAVSGEPPFAHLRDNLVVENLANPRPSQKLSGTTDAVWELVLSMVDVDSVKRPTLDIVIDHLKDLAVKGSIETAGSPPDVVDLTEPSADIAAPHELNSPPPPAPVPTPTPVTPPTPICLTRLTDNTPVSTLIKAVDTGSEKEREQALILLLQACLDDDSRVELYECGVSVLVRVVERRRAHFEQTCAFECLRWLKCEDLEDAKLSVEKYNALYESIRDIKPRECTAVVELLRNGDRYSKLKAAAYCACTAELGFHNRLLRVGVVRPLLSLLKTANKWIKLWAAQALGNFAAEYIEEYIGPMGRTGVLAPLTKILRSSSSTSLEKRLAACAVGCYGKNFILSNVISIDEVVLLLEPLLHDEVNSQKSLVLLALGFISDSSQDGRKGVVAHVEIPLLAEFVRTGTNLQKQEAAHLLGSFTEDGVNRAVVAKGGAIAPLLSLLQNSTDDQKTHAAYALGRLAETTIYCEPIVDEGALIFLPELLRGGSERTKESAMLALVRLADIETYKTVIGTTDTIPRVLKILETGSEYLQQQALLCLLALVKNSPDNCVRATNEGAASALVMFLQDEDNSLHYWSIEVLQHLASVSDNYSGIATSGAVPVLITILKTEDSMTTPRVVDTFRNLANSDSTFMASIVDDDLIEHLTSVRHSRDEEANQAAATLLSMIRDMKQRVKRRRIND